MYQAMTLWMRTAEQGGCYFQQPSPGMVQLENKLQVVRNAFGDTPSIAIEAQMCSAGTL